MSLREAAKQALEALKMIDNAMPFPVAKHAIKQLRDALAEPEQEPAIYPEEAFEMGLEAVAYYTHPPQHKPLTDEEIDAVTIEQWGEMKGYPLAAHRAFARAIERAHGIGGEA